MDFYQYSKAEKVVEKEELEKKQDFDTKEVQKFDQKNTSLSNSFKDDLICLYSMWFNKTSGNSHAERLDAFYKPQAQQYDKFRQNFLWGRKPMLAACAARLSERSNLVWIDLGGGTGENVDMMQEYMSLDKFKKIYVVDLAKSLCQVAKDKVQKKGWNNVQVVEFDACKFNPKESAALVTFSYSLSMIPPFHSAVDNAVSMLDNSGILGVCDFYVSGKYDEPMRQMSWYRRFFWRSIFDTDGIDLGPERRHYMEHKLKRIYENNSEGSIPYVPYFRAPYYIWLGQKSGQSKQCEQKAYAPPLFPPTFLYSQSWEDPEPDMKVLDIKSDDVCLTLTSGGCNALNLLIQGAAKVVSVDCNPAQSALLELKYMALKRLSFQDFWLMFGEGKHPEIERIYIKDLAPFLSQNALKFWNKRLYYFTQGLYYQGGMGQFCWIIQSFFYVMGQDQKRKQLVSADTLEKQRQIYHTINFLRVLSSADKGNVAQVLQFLLAVIFFNRLVLWFGSGVPQRQYSMITQGDNTPMVKYVQRFVGGLMEESHLKKHNYFYYNCLTGKFTQENCPNYLRRTNFDYLRENNRIDHLEIRTEYFLSAVKSQKYNKVILMDHIDWQNEPYARELAKTLHQQMYPNGKVIWRSAGVQPWYAKIFQESGFKVTCVSRIDEGFMDRVNMYASFYVAQRK